MNKINVAGRVPSEYRRSVFYDILKSLEDGINLFIANRNRGATSIADGGTITHGLASIPTRVNVTCSVSGEFASVTALAATTFTVAIKKHDNTAGTTQTIYWTAEV